MRRVAGANSWVCTLRYPSAMLPFRLYCNGMLRFPTKSLQYRALETCPIFSPITTSSLRINMGNLE